MIDEIALQRDVNRAARAEALLRNELFQEAYATFERELVEAWKGTPSDQPRIRERIWDMVKANERHRIFLQGIVRDGKIAQADLDMLAEQRKRSA